MTAPAPEITTSEIPSEATVPVGGLVKQPHGGAIRRGNPGNKGGPGIAPNALRRALRGSLARRIPTLRDIADGKGEGVKPADQLAAINLMARYGIGTETTMTVISPDVVQRISGTIQAVMECPELSNDAKERLLERIESVWAG